MNAVHPAVSDKGVHALQHLKLGDIVLDDEIVGNRSQVGDVGIFPDG